MKKFKSAVYERLPWFLKDSTWRVLTITSGVYCASGLIGFVHWSKIQYAMQFPLYIWDLLSSIAHLEIAAFFVLLWGFLLLILKTAWFWILKSIGGGFLRIVTIVPAKFVAKFMYKKSEVFNDRVDRIRNWAVDNAKVMWEKFKGWPLLLQCYTAPAVVFFILLVVIIGLLATGLRLLLVSKAGEILVENILVTTLKHIPFLGEKISTSAQDFVHGIFRYLETMSQRFRAQMSFDEDVGNSEKESEKTEAE